jgi:hypothetical protein
MLDLIENILDRNRIKNSNSFLFKTLKEDLEKEGFFLMGRTKKWKVIFFRQRTD